MALVNLTRGGLSGGYKKYLQTLVPILAATERLELAMFSPANMDLAPISSVRNERWPTDDEYRGFRALRGKLSDFAPDVVFIPTARYVDTPFPTVVMVRNMEPLVLPFSGNSFADGMRNVARRYVARASCRKASRIIAVSGYVHDFLRDRWNVPPAKLAVVPHGVGEVIPKLGHVRPRSVKADVGHQFIFAAGSVRPSRGLEDVIKAVALLRSRGADVDLVIAGTVSGSTEAYHGALRALSEASGIAEHVVWAGDLTPREMAWCFSNCRAFAMTSRVEACPNTVLEALSHGTLSVSSTLPPMPEFFGDGALYYKAGNEGELASRLAEIMALDDRARDDLAGRARARAALFSWSDTARGTIAVLRTASRS